MGNIKEFFIGKEVDKRINTNCSVPINLSTIVNVFNMMWKGGGEFDINCEFEKGSKKLGDLDVTAKLGRNGLQVRTSSTSGLIGKLARESDILDEILGI